jgi:hypothetical protein
MTRSDELRGDRLVTEQAGLQAGQPSQQRLSGRQPGNQGEAAAAGPCANVLTDLPSFTGFRKASCNTAPPRLATRGAGIQGNRSIHASQGRGTQTSIGAPIRAAWPRPPTPRWGQHLSKASGHRPSNVMRVISETIQLRISFQHREKPAMASQQVKREERQGLVPRGAWEFSRARSRPTSPWQAISSAWLTTPRAFHASMAKAGVISLDGKRYKDTRRADSVSTATKSASTRANGMVRRMCWTASCASGAYRCAASGARRRLCEDPPTFADGRRAARKQAGRPGRRKAGGIPPHVCPLIHGARWNHLGSRCTRLRGPGIPAARRPRADITSK